MDPGVAVIAESARSTRKQLSVVYGVMLAVCAVGIIYGLIDCESSRSVARMMAMSCLGGVVFGALLVATMLPSKLVALLADPQRIVWFYTIDTAPGRIMIGDDRGKIHWAEFSSFHLIEQGLEGLKTVAPHARCGYSQEAMKAFRKNPSGFRVSP